MHLITSINFRAKLIVCLNGARASAFLPNTEGGNPVIFTTSRHKASLPPSGTKAQKQAVKSLLAPVAPKTRLSLFCLHVFFFPEHAADLRLAAAQQSKPRTQSGTTLKCCGFPLKHQVCVHLLVLNSTYRQFKNSTCSGQRNKADANFNIPTNVMVIPSFAKPKKTGINRHSSRDTLPVKSGQRGQEVRSSYG